MTDRSLAQVRGVGLRRRASLLTLTTYVSCVVMTGSIHEKPVYLRGLPAGLVREAKALAARRGVTLAALVIDALARTIRDEQSARGHEVATPSDMTRSLRWFEQHRERLSHELGGQYAAIVDDAVVDHDADFDALAQRVFARLGARDVFMPLVPASGEVVQPLRVRSPRLKSIVPASDAPQRSDGDSERPGPARGRARGPR